MVHRGAPAGKPDSTYFMQLTQKWPPDRRLWRFLTRFRAGEVDAEALPGVWTSDHLPDECGSA